MKHILYSLAMLAGFAAVPMALAQTSGTDPHAGHDMHGGHDSQASQPASAAQDPHAGHDMPSEQGAPTAPAAPDPHHAGHDMHGAPAAASGPWSYLDRDNPPPYTEGRWEMIPVPGYGHMFLHTGGISQELKCAALNNPGVMVDRATRARCAGTAAPIPQEQKPATPKEPAPAHVH